MRISDWSSDVCSSDLRIRRRPFIEEEAIAMVEVGAQQKLPHIPELRRIFGANAVSPAGNIGEFIVDRIGRDQPGCLQYWLALELRVIGDGIGYRHRNRTVAERLRSEKRRVGKE